MQDQGAQIIVVADPAEGMAASIRAGIAARSADYPRALLTPWFKGQR